MSRYKNSRTLLDRALKTIPTGSQTFSKSHIVYPSNQSPLFLSRGEGGHVWDVDDNEYIDLVCGLLPVLLGYKDRDVDSAIIEQLENGITFSLATELEVILSEMLVDIIPCAEMVRLGKSGTDVTSAAIRIARAVTKKEHVISCGYHGWQDWYIGTTTRKIGIPESVQQLTHRAEYNNIDSFKAVFDSCQGNVAAVIMEPMNIEEPAPGFLNDIKELAHDNNALFIFDEVITGFRYSLGGAQELFNIKPDLACFGKAMGNGMPISAIVGAEKYMKYFDEVFFSGTFGGETLSIAAAIAVIEKLKREPVLDQIHKFGTDLKQKVNTLITANKLENVLSLKGNPCWTILDVNDHSKFDNYTIKTFLQTSFARKGVLCAGSHNICYAHNSEDLQIIESVYKSILNDLANSLEDGTLKERMGCDPVYPVFSVRSFKKNH